MHRIVLRSCGDLVVGTRCPGCGRAGSSRVCTRCLHDIAQLPAVADAAFADAGPAGRMVRAGKAGHWRSAGRELARLMVQRSPRLLERSAHDVLTWIPADRRRRAQRGGHLPERLARALARELGIPARGMLVRCAGTPQRGLDRSERAQNVERAFSARDLTAADRHLRVLLVDDVRTTGATFTAARCALQPHVRHVTVIAAIGVGTTGRRDRWGGSEP